MAGGCVADVDGVVVSNPGSPPPDVETSGPARVPSRVVAASVTTVAGAAEGAPVAVDGLAVAVPVESPRADLSPVETGASVPPAVLPVPAGLPAPWLPVPSRPAP
ncbi:hypothetical protein DLJ60_03605 [Micromonospora chalcea]|uniref:Uncharacterized protein n=1 Tax=Micromonospora chalcea TaxID=1874 RepID=A0ABX9Y9B2_MICCH|nr:hypothetical protein DLJ60_03605 [Micromonospora chalcea]